MKSHSVLAALLLIVPALRADVTVNYRTEFKPPEMVPPQLSGDSVIRMKRNRGSWSFGRLTIVMDFVRQEVTLIDPTRKVFATMPAIEYSAKVKEVLQAAAGSTMPGMDKAAAASEPRSQTRKTGRTEMIQGIRAEEQETTISVEVPVPVGPQTKMKMITTSRIWTAVAEEALSKPAIRELAGFNLWMKYFLGSSNMFDLTELPDAGQGTVLRMSFEMKMAGQADLPGLDPDAPFLQEKVEITGISTDAIEESMFEVPKGFGAAPIEELLKTAVESQMQPASPARAQNTGNSQAAGIQAYVPHRSPIHRTEPAVPSAHPEGGDVLVLLALDTHGNVVQAEALSGAEPLREPAINTVRQWKFRSVIRDGQPVPAYTDANVFFLGDRGPTGNRDTTAVMAAMNRLSQLESEFPRTPKQVLADLEQDAGDSGMQHSYSLNELVRAAWKAGAGENAARYAKELLETATKYTNDWNYGNAIQDGHTVLGLLALQHGDLTGARKHLLDSARTSGSPQMNSFGPTMMLAKELLAKGEQNIVLEYFSLCGNFWKMGETRLQAWADEVRAGKMPQFAMNLWQ